VRLGRDLPPVRTFATTFLLRGRENSGETVAKAVISSTENRARCFQAN
jgi:hypothetical protein